MLLVVAAGCTTTAAPTGAPGDGATATSTNEPAEAAAESGDPRRSSAADAGVPATSNEKPVRVGVRYHFEYDAPFPTPDELCANSPYWGDRCGSCGTGPAAPGVAVVYAAGKNPAKMTACGTLPSSSGGAVGQVDYCCETPFIMTEASTSAPKSCADVCASEGLVCTTQAPIYDGFGGSPRPGSALLEYRAGATGTRTWMTTCSEAPPATKSIAGNAGKLEAFTCACVDARAKLPTPP